MGELQHPDVSVRVRGRATACLMASDHEPAAVRRLAAEFVQTMRVSGEGITSSGRIGEPIRIIGPTGAPHGWFVPITDGEVLTGFVELEVDRQVRRSSTFQRRPGSLAGCPAAASWLDTDTIRRRAEAVLRPGDATRAPYLSYDRVPDRLAWAVSVVSADGGERTVYVAGEVAWEGGGGQVDTID
ncbi:MAG: hypothetical protein GY788_07905 [bacterium]|nr:hypothetical protein [bacterium]